MLRERLLSAAVLAGIVSGLLCLDWAFPLFGVGGWWLAPLVLFFTGMTALELARMLKTLGHSVQTPIVIAASVLTAVSAGVPLLWSTFGGVYPADCPIGKLGWVGIAAFMGIAIALLNEMRLFGRLPDDQRVADEHSGGGIERISAVGLAVCYIGIPMACVTAMRNLGIEANWGIAAIVTFIVVTKASDTGAYFTGRTIGRHKLIPRLSPGKTWEGAVGGVGLSVLVSYVCFRWLFPLVVGFGESGDAFSHGSAPWWGPLVFGGCCAISGMVGDLAESYIKRVSGVKDSGNAIPGMGGVWDVTDSLIGAAVPAFLCFAAGLAGPVS